MARVAPEVADALAAGRPVVALESTIIAHGLPRPDNLRVAREIEDVVRGRGAVPATIAVLGGEVCVGLEGDALERLATGDDVANAIAVQGDGKVVLAGTQDIEGNAADTAAVTARLRTDGSLDTTYDGDGRTSFRPARDVQANDLVIAPTGEIVIAVGDRGGNTNADDDDTFTVLRLRGNGSLDPAWNGDGEARTNINPGIGGFEQARAVALRNDASVVAAGVAAPPTRGFLYAVAVYRNR
jgi:uncharacterized delta-60 repeat protein